MDPLTSPLSQLESDPLLRDILAPRSPLRSFGFRGGKTGNKVTRVMCLEAPRQFLENKKQRSIPLVTRLLVPSASTVKPGISAPC